MNFEITTTPRFEKDIKALAKRYKSIKSDLAKFLIELSNNPFQGDEIATGVRKIRMAITSKGRGKSGGARVITFNLITTSEEGRIYLIEIYDKSDFSSIDVDILKEIISDII